MAPEREFLAGRLGAIPCGKKIKQHTHKTKQKTTSRLALNAHPDAVAEAQFCTQAKTSDEKPKDLRG